MRSVNYLYKNLFTNLICLFFAVVLFPVQAVWAEGSKELNQNGGNRAFLVSGTTVVSPFLFPTNGTMKVYAKAGEIINVGSSTQGMNAGTINLRSPNNGPTYTSGTSTTVGRIVNRAQEIQGPFPAAGGYTPYTHTVLPAEEGVWEVEFIAENGGQISTENPNPNPISAGGNWTQPAGQYIAAFDVTVTVAGAPLTGRVYTNIFSGILGTFDVGFNGIFYIQTIDGYRYQVDNNGQAGNGFSFFANNKGFRKGDGTASYLSVNSIITPNIQDPRASDTPTDITHKIFFNRPAADLPLNAPTPNGTTWLLNAVSSPTLTNTLFTGTEGTLNIGGTAPLGGSFSFDVNKNGTYTIAIDVNHNNSYADPIDRILTGPAVSGTNKISWDGLDGQGNKATAGSYASTINVSLLGGEVHFPFFDVERNINGIIVTRENGFAFPDYTVYWDDSAIDKIGTTSNPIKNPQGQGQQSTINGHAWGGFATSSTDEIDFGNSRGLDTYTFIEATPPAPSIVNFQLRESDLEVTDIVPTGGLGCVGQLVTYTFTVKNNGPSDAANTKFNFTFPTTLTNVTISSVATTGTSAETGATTPIASPYASTLSLSNGAVRTYTVTGKATAAPGAGGGSIVVTASILRGVDSTDPDATNPDAAQPTDPQLECDSAPSGTGCNNIKTNTLNFLALPDAGADQSIYQDETVTLTDTNPGVWSEYATFPQTVIATPAALTTTVTGFHDVGIYQFLRTNASGCVDTVKVTVVPKTIDVPSVFTPNGDGKNDTFNIPGIEAFPGSQLIISNRWGNEVYHSNDYKNTWSGDGLSEGTYYYVINKKELSGKFTTYKGWIFLKRGR